MEIVRPNERTVAETVESLWSAQGDERFVAPFPHWLAILPPGWRIGATGSKDLAWRHVIDERMPILCSISVSPLDENGRLLEGHHMDDHYKAIRPGDWMRLCFVDAAGDAPYPYDQKFLEGIERDHVYDRFHSMLPAPDRTRYLVSSYSLIAVGCGYFFDRWVRMHMRRHYYQMALLAHFELAALLAVSSRISRAVADWEIEHARADAEVRLSARLQIIERDFLQLLHRFRFTGISNQLQAAEMFDLLRARMRLETIFKDLKDEITTATGFLSAREAERQTKEAYQQTLAANRLSIVATLGLVIGLPMAFFGMNVLTSTEWLNALHGSIRIRRGAGRHWKNGT
jgi:hypothetical protein